MASNGNTENLTREQTHSMLRYLLTRMNADTRCALMADMPVAYSRLYPTVDSSLILGHVREGIGR